MITRMPVLLASVISAAPSALCGPTSQGSQEPLQLIGALGELFGNAVDVTGNTLVVGAPNAQHADPYTGAVYVFERTDCMRDDWMQTAVLVAGDGTLQDGFGSAVASDGQRVIVGAPWGDGAAPGTGKAYIFERDAGGPGSWGQVARLFAAQGEADDWYGYCVSISADTAVVGAMFSNAVEFQGGEAHVYQRSSGPPVTWREAATLASSDPNHGEYFGTGVSICGDTAIVGAPGDDEGGPTAGAVFVFERDQGGPDRWGQSAKLLAPGTDYVHGFGGTLSLDGDAFVTGSPIADGATYDSGVAYLIRRDDGSGTGWVPEARLMASNGQEGDDFGSSVSLSAALAVIGSRSGDASGVDSGAAYLAVRNGAQPHESSVALNRVVPNMKAPGVAAFDGFGISVSVDGGTAVVGAWLDDDGGQGSGSVFIYRVGARPSAYCSGDGSGLPCPCGNSGAPGHGCASSSAPGGCRLVMCGGPSVTWDSTTLCVADSVANQTGMCFQGDEAVSAGSGAPLGDGLRCAGGAVVRLEIVTADAAGSANSTVPIAATGGVSPGDTRYYQWWYRDPTGSPCGFGFNLSNGLEVTWAP